MSEKNNFDINMAAIFDGLIRKIWIIILAAVIAAGAAYVYVSFFVDPMYSSTATIYIGNSSYGQTNYSEVSLSETLAKDFEEIIKKRAVLEQVADTLDLNMSASTLRNSMTVKNISNTRILDITISTRNPALSKNIADTVCSVASEKFVEIVKVDYVSIIDMGSLSSSPSNINITKSMVLAAFAGALLSAFVIMIKIIRDDKIKNPDDVEFYLGLSVLGTTPFSRELETDASKTGSVIKRKLLKRNHHH